MPGESMEKSPHASEWAEELTVAQEIARCAGQEILAIQRSGQNLQIENKLGVNQLMSPVTIADQKANQLICQTLVAHFPTYGLLTEEEVTDERLLKAVQRWPDAKMSWIIDPLDGTKAFINGGTDYGIHIGLTQNGKAILGVNYYPVTDICYYAVQGYGSYKQVGENPPQRLYIAISQIEEIRAISNTDPTETAPIYQALIQRSKFTALDSCGWKICSIAEGNYDLYISMGVRGGAWDYCSSDIILREAGGFISDLKGQPIDYCKNRLEQGAIVCGHKELYEQVLQVTR